MRLMHSVSPVYTVVITTGAVCISEVLRKCSLQVLEMSSNKIGDNGITAIARTLSSNQISELNVREGGISLTGVRSLVYSKITSQQQC